MLLFIILILILMSRRVYYPFGFYPYRRHMYYRRPMYMMHHRMYRF